MGENTEKLIAHEQVTTGVTEAAKQMGITQADLMLASQGNADALARVTAALDQQVQETDASTFAMTANGETIVQFHPEIDKVRDSVTKWAAASKEAAANTSE